MATASWRSEESRRAAGEAKSRPASAGRRAKALGFLLTPVALGFLASAAYFPADQSSLALSAEIEGRGERLSSEPSTIGTGSRLYNPANLCAAGASCTRIERHDQRYARRIMARSTTSKSSTYGSGHYAGLRRN